PAARDRHQPLERSEIGQPPSERPRVAVQLRPRHGKHLVVAAGARHGVVPVYSTSDSDMVPGNERRWKCGGWEMHFSIPDLGSMVFLAALGQIIVANVLLSGDNAVVIALAAHGLPERQRRPAILFGSLGAIVLLIIFCAIVNFLLTVPYLKLVGGA